MENLPENLLFSVNCPSHHMHRHFPDQELPVAVEAENEPARNPVSVIDNNQNWGSDEDAGSGKSWCKPGDSSIRHKVNCHVKRGGLSGRLSASSSRE